MWVLEALTPLPGSRGDIWTEFNDRLATGQTLWFGGGALAVAAVWALAVDRAGGRGAVGWSRLLGVALSLCAMVGGMAVVAREGGRVYLDKPVPYTAVCKGSHPVVCVHPAFTRVIPAVRGHTRALYERLRGTAGEFDTLVQSWAAGDPPIGRGRRVSFALQAPGEAGARRVARDLVIQSFEPVCNAPAPVAGDPAGTSSQGSDGDGMPGYLEGMVEEWLASPDPASDASTPELSTPESSTAGTAGVPELGAAGSAWRALDESGRRAWFRAHYASFAACTLTPDDLTRTGLPGARPATTGRASGG